MKKGFTILELMVVVGLIAVLALIIVAFLGGAKTKALDSTIEHQVSDIRSQANLYRGVAVENELTFRNTPITPEVRGDLFTSANADQYSLVELINGLPAGTAYVYASDDMRPSEGGQWVFAAATSTGAICVDWIGNSEKYVGNPPQNLGEFANVFARIGRLTCIST